MTAVVAFLFVSLNAWRVTAPKVEHLLALVGYLLLGIGIAGRIWAGSYVRGFKNAKLIVDGPYSITRNPLYFFSFVGGVGVMLLTETMTLPIVFIVWFWSVYRKTMVREEQRLHELHAPRSRLTTPGFRNSGRISACFRSRLPIPFMPRSFVFV